MFKVESPSIPDTKIPLTPALSHREREKTFASSIGKSRAEGIRTLAWQIKSLLCCRYTTTRNKFRGRCISSDRVAS